VSECPNWNRLSRCHSASELNEMVQYRGRVGGQTTIPPFPDPPDACMHCGPPLYTLASHPRLPPPARPPSVSPVAVSDHLWHPAAGSCCGHQSSARFGRCHRPHCSCGRFRHSRRRGGCIRAALRWCSSPRHVCHLILMGITSRGMGSLLGGHFLCSGSADRTAWVSWALLRRLCRSVHSSSHATIGTLE
jgi:hypothetical protein